MVVEVLKVRGYHRSSIERFFDRFLLVYLCDPLFCHTDKHKRENACFGARGAGLDAHLRRLLVIIVLCCSPIFGGLPLQSDAHPQVRHRWTPGDAQYACRVSYLPETRKKLVE